MVARKHEINNLPPGYRGFLLLSILCVLLPHITRLPIWLDILCIGVILWRMLFDVGKLPSLPSWLRLCLTIGGSVGVWLSYATLMGREPGSALLLMMLCLKLTELRSERDVFQCVFLSYFVVVIGFLFSQSIWMGLYMFLVVWLITTSLVAYAHVSGRLSQQHFKLHLAYAGKLILQALPLGLLLFVLFPRLPGPLWTLPEDSYNAKTGLSDHMEPGNISRLTDSDAVAFRVHFQDPLPEAGHLYWRGPVFWHFDGRRWSNPTEQVKKYYSLSYQAQGKRLNYTVTLEPHDKRWLFAMDLPAQVPPQAYITPDLQLMADHPVNQLLRYQIASYNQYRLERDVRPIEAYTWLPKSAAPLAKQLVATWLTTTTVPKELVKKALDYFREQPFYYTRTPPRLTADPVDEFLFSTRRGFCEHFASSFTALMRLAGVPARVVTGYLGGEMNPMADYMIVRQASAHAWAEVWLPGQGWVRVDPTAVIPPSRVENVNDLERIQPLSRRALDARQLTWVSDGLRRAGFAWDAVNNRWNQWVVGFNDQRQMSLLENLGLGAWSDYALVVLLAVFSTVFAVVASLLLLRKKPKPLPAASRYYLRFCRKMSRRGIPCVASEGAWSYAKRIQQQCPSLTQLVKDIADDYYQLRYAGQGDRLVLKRLRRNVRRV